MTRSHRFLAFSCLVEKICDFAQQIIGGVVKTPLHKPHKTTARYAGNSIAN
ncbi:hypothetical protein V1281_004710 [Nitrobacteraceae bacterium AZCC 2161]